VRGVPLGTLEPIMKFTVTLIQSFPRGWDTALAQQTEMVVFAANCFAALSQVIRDYPHSWDTVTSINIKENL